MLATTKNFSLSIHFFTSFSLPFLYALHYFFCFAIQKKFYFRLYLLLLQHTKFSFACRENIVLTIILIFLWQSIIYRPFFCSPLDVHRIIKKWYMHYDYSFKTSAYNMCWIAFMSRLINLWFFYCNPIWQKSMKHILYQSSSGSHTWWSTVEARGERHCYYYGSILIDHTMD